MTKPVQARFDEEQLEQLEKLTELYQRRFPRLKVTASTVLRIAVENLFKEEESKWQKDSTGRSSSETLEPIPNSG